MPYWGTYVLHDNNRDINLSQVSSRASDRLVLHGVPPIMHDCHESGTLLYTYSGGPPQNPNLDPVLFGELSWFANWEMTQMAKWNMPGVYTHAFMDAWSPGLSRVGGLQPQRAHEDVRDPERKGHRRRLPPGRPTGRGGGRRGRGGRKRRRRRPTASALFRATQHGRAHGPWRKPGAGVVPGASRTRGCGPRTSPGETTSTTSRPAFCRRSNSRPWLPRPSWRTSTSRPGTPSGRAEPPFGYVIPVQRDMTRVARVLEVIRAQEWKWAA